MALKKLSLKTTILHEGNRLDQVLAQWLPEVLGQSLSKGKVRKLVIAGAVYLNGKRVRIASKELMANARVEVYVDLKKLNESTAESSPIAPFQMTSDLLLFEDEHLIIVNKPPGLPTQPTLDEARINLFVSVKRFLAHRSNAPESQIYLGLHHRLDRDTSGVILFTKSREANPGVADLFSNHQIQKTYQALSLSNSREDVPETWSIKNYLGKQKLPGKVNKSASVRSGGDFAHTDFKLIKKFSRALWVEAQPKTGRTHQIRVHLAENKMPIFGDTLYGGPDYVFGPGTQINTAQRTLSGPPRTKGLSEPLYGGPASMGGTLKVPRVMLHAVRLRFNHPISKAEILVESPLPEDFQKCLKFLTQALTEKLTR